MDNHEYQYSDSLNGRCRVCDKPRANSIHRTTFTLADMKEWREKAAALTAEAERLKGLIRHAWIHSGYPNCGYLEMTTEQKATYDAVIKEPTHER